MNEDSETIHSNQNLRLKNGCSPETTLSRDMQIKTSPKLHNSLFDIPRSLKPVTLLRMTSQLLLNQIIKNKL